MKEGKKHTQTKTKIQVQNIEDTMDKYKEMDPMITMALHFNA